MHAACARCKSQNMKCPKQEGESSCTRCLRAGVPCIAAPPSRQGKRPREQGSSPPPEIPVEQVVHDLSLPAQALVSRFVADWGEECGGAADILRGAFAGSATPPSRSTLFMLLRHFAAWATASGSEIFLWRTCRLAAACGIPMQGIILGLEKEMPAAVLRLPKVLQDSFASYEEKGEMILCTRVNPTAGGLFLRASKCFEARVCTAEALREHWRTGGTQTSNRGGSAQGHDDAGLPAVWSRFVHPDDKAVLPTAFGRLLSKMTLSAPSAPQASQQPHPSSGAEAPAGQVGDSAADAESIYLCSAMLSAEKSDRKESWEWHHGEALVRILMMGPSSPGTYVPCQVKLCLGRDLASEGAHFGLALGTTITALAPVSGSTALSTSAPYGVHCPPASLLELQHGTSSCGATQVTPNIREAAAAAPAESKAAVGESSDEPSRAAGLAAGRSSWLEAEGVDFLLGDLEEMLRAGASADTLG